MFLYKNIIDDYKMNYNIISRVNYFDLIPNEIVVIIFDFMMYDRVPINKKDRKIGPSRKYKYNAKYIEHDYKKQNQIKKIAILSAVCKDWYVITRNIFFDQISITTQIRDIRNIKKKYNNPPCELIINKFIRDLDYEMVELAIYKMKKAR
jgi:hypothetical protein